MAIPVYLQQFKAAGIYRIVFDKSTVLNVDSEILRLVVGYSEQGPFNIPTYVTSVSQFKTLYGDISKKLEKRGIYFHRLAMQALTAGPILCLNLKKFDGETVDGASISTDFNPTFDPIDTVKLYVEDIYDTSRFWELNADKLDNLKAADGGVMDEYINICTTNTKKTSATYFIRKASGLKVSSYNISVKDWYNTSEEAMPEYLESYQNSKISDFFAEIYVFDGKFTAEQVLASNTLKNYFELETYVTSTGKVKVKLDENGDQMIKLRSYVTDAFGDAQDTLDTLYDDETSGALGHYIGCLIPYFKNKQGVYEALDIVFNNDQDVHNMMMSFNVDMLEEDGTANIDLNGSSKIPTTDAVKRGVVKSNGITLDKIYDGEAYTKLLGNSNAPIVADAINSYPDTFVFDADGNASAYTAYSIAQKRVNGTLWCSERADDHLVLKQVCGDDTVTIYFDAANKEYYWTKFGVGYVNDSEEFVEYPDYYGTYCSYSDAYDVDTTKCGIVCTEKIINSIARVEIPEEMELSTFHTTAVYIDTDENIKVATADVNYTTDLDYLSDITKENGGSDGTSVYGSSVSFIPFLDSNWENGTYEGSAALICSADGIYDRSLLAILQEGDRLLADDGTADMDGDEEADAADNYYDNVFVTEIKTIYDDAGLVNKYVIKLTGDPMVYNHSCGGYTDENGSTETHDSESGYGYIVRIDNPLNQEIGTMYPQYLEGYTYKNAKPESTGMYGKLKWQQFILSCITDYKGLRTGLLNKSEIDYRYIVDTFESFVESGCKNVLSYLAKEKQSAFVIANFPSVRTFTKCPYTSFTDSKGLFNVEYVVKGYNKKKAASIKFDLPSDGDGASFIAFYTPLKFSDGYVDTIVPSAGLVSNLFMEKYLSRQPYYIVAGPNYGSITASGLVGPDYKYSQDELQIIEPFGVNCMVYRPNFGTFINANQTAKQTPVSALSKVNVRELVIYLQDEIEKVLQAYQWEFNNQTTRNAILDKANSICSRIQANGGIQTYQNIMDESNNTPEIIDNEMAILSTHIEPGMGCGKMVQELTIYRTGQMSSMIDDK